MQHFLMIDAAEAFKRGQVDQAAALYARITRDSLDHRRTAAAWRLLDLIGRL